MGAIITPFLNSLVAWNAAVGPITQNADSSLLDYSIVNKFNSTLFLYGGTRVRLTLTAALLGNTVINKVAIGRANPTTVYAFTTAIAPVVPILFGGSRSVTIPAGGSVVSDPADFTILQNNAPAPFSVNIALDYSAGGGSVRSRSTAVTNFNAYKKLTTGTDDADTVAKSGYTATSGPNCFTISKIEVG